VNFYIGSFDNNAKTQLILPLKGSLQLVCFAFLVKSFLYAESMNLCTRKRKKHEKINKQSRKSHLARDSLKSKREAWHYSLFHSFIELQGEKQ